MSKRMLLLSSSNTHGYGYLEHAKQFILDLLKDKGINTVLFVPYAAVKEEAIVHKFKEQLFHWGIETESILDKDPVEAVNKAKAIFVCGGNTFKLLKTLYENNLIDIIRERVNNGKLLYMSASAGTNVAGMSINTTNDMPIVYPPKFDALGLFPFIINPHYLPDQQFKNFHGETRDQRLQEYLHLPNAHTVLAMREGAILYIDGNSAHIRGVDHARLFMKGKEPVDLEVGADISYLMK